MNKKKHVACINLVGYINMEKQSRRMVDVEVKSYKMFVYTSTAIIQSVF